jgi:hypothetical protein
MGTSDISNEEREFLRELPKALHRIASSIEKVADSIARIGGAAAGQDRSRGPKSHGERCRRARKDPGHAGA